MSAGTWTVIRVNRGALCLAPDEETAKNWASDPAQWSRTRS